MSELSPGELPKEIATPRFVTSNPDRVGFHRPYKLVPEASSVENQSKLAILLNPIELLKKIKFLLSKTKE
jgi:hypothetical protein